MPKYSTQDLITFERKLHQLYYDLMVDTTSFLDKPALAPSACEDFELERRKHELVKLILITDAQGVTAPTVDELLGCQDEA